MIIQFKKLPLWGIWLGMLACQPSETEELDPEPLVYTIPVVVHIMHKGEAVGEGSNHSTERIQGQIRRLNEDFRRLANTIGYNEHPLGGDAHISFVLANQRPDGKPSDGIVRVNGLNSVNPVDPNDRFRYYAHFSYWPPERYLNVWSVPLNPLQDIFLGEATGPDSDLPGIDLLLRGEPWQPEGIIINAPHFGESTESNDYNLGRTLTHEVGHYLGLLHTWGKNDCEHNDYCDDTPAVDHPVLGCSGPPPLGCKGEPLLLENYMNYGEDRCLTMFTQDQIARMRYVLENSPRRSSLWSWMK